MEYALGLSDASPSHNLPLVIESTKPLRFRFARAGDRIVARVEHVDADGPLIVTSVSGRLEPLDAASLRAKHAAMLDKLGADEGRIEAAFSFFIRKR